MLAPAAGRRPLVLILSLEGDRVADEGEVALRRRGAEVVRLAPERFPGETNLTLAWSATGPARRTLVRGRERIDLDAIGAVWHRRVQVRRPPEIADLEMRDFAAREIETLLVQLWSELDAPFVPAPLSVIRAGQDKLRQLSLATALGFEIPPSLVTSQPEELLAFHRAHGGRVITKLLSHSSMDASGLTNDLVRFTEPMTWSDVCHAGAVRSCPVYAQAYVPKQVELRVTVVGERVFAAEIRSQQRNHTRHDWRKARDVEHAPHELPAVVAERCRRITARLGLRYGAIDLILTPAGEYVFLEINPAGEYQWIEKRAGLPITDAIAELLVSLASARTERSDP